MRIHLLIQWHEFSYRICVSLGVPFSLRLSIAHISCTSMGTKSVCSLPILYRSLSFFTSFSMCFFCMIVFFYTYPFRVCVCFLFVEFCRILFVTILLLCVDRPNFLRLTSPNNNNNNEKTLTDTHKHSDRSWIWCVMRFYFIFQVTSTFLWPKEQNTRKKCIVG